MGGYTGSILSIDLSNRSITATPYGQSTRNVGWGATAWDRPCFLSG
jgi:aldehyde:ferredoxin oxidoreductase